jgi:hypothetical protein
MIVRCYIDSTMADAGFGLKPFLYTKEETKTWATGRLKWLSIRTQKRMNDIGEEKRPIYVKTYELRTVRLLGLLLSDREQVWNYQNLQS